MEINSSPLARSQQPLTVHRSDLLPAALHRAESVRELERELIEQQGIGSFTLMRRAARAVLQHLLARYPAPGTLRIFCGSGNNGGDGYALASLARQQGLAVELIACGDSTKITGDALQARQCALQDGISVSEFQQDMDITDGVIVDALLGIGLTAAVRTEAAEVIAVINNSSCPVVAIDLPSGLCADTGQVFGVAVTAQLTVTLVGVKPGLLTGVGPDYCGQLQFSDLANAANASMVSPTNITSSRATSSVTTKQAASSERLDIRSLLPLLGRRQASAHKGQFGHVMVAGGGAGMAGAAALASAAAGRVGAGLVSCATRPEHVAAIVGLRPEVMVHGVISGQEIEPLLARASVLVVGPGLGVGSWGEQLLQKVLAQPVPMVVDADALNILAAGRVVKKPYNEQWILTPHPGEAARLLACTVAEVQRDRFAAVEQLQSKFGGAVVLKGAGSLVADSEHSLVGLCPYGNPGMASGGMGDVLSGVLAALLAQGLSVSEAARLGVCLHGLAGDLAAAEGERGMLAKDLLVHLRALVN